MVRCRNMGRKSSLPWKVWPWTTKLTASQPLDPILYVREVLWEEKSYPNKKRSLSLDNISPGLPVCIRTLKNHKQICKVITGIELLTHLRAFFPLRQLKQHASSRKEVMRSGSDNAHQIKCVVKGKMQQPKRKSNRILGCVTKATAPFLIYTQSCF